jgi:hypothetical protein
MNTRQRHYKSKSKIVQNLRFKTNTKEIHSSSLINELYLYLNGAGFI